MKSRFIYFIYRDCCSWIIHFYPKSCCQNQVILVKSIWKNIHLHKWFVHLHQDQRQSWIETFLPLLMCNLCLSSWFVILPHWWSHPHSYQRPYKPQNSSITLIDKDILCQISMSVETEKKRCAWAYLKAARISFSMSSLVNFLDINIKNSLKSTVPLPVRSNYNIVLY